MGLPPAAAESEEKTPKSSSKTGAAKDQSAASEATADAGLSETGGNGNGKIDYAALERAGVASKVAAADRSGESHSDQFARFQSDAPSCDTCGAITVRNGNCYLCYNCGNSMGCS